MFRPSTSRGFPALGWADRRSRVTASIRSIVSSIGAGPTAQFTPKEVETRSEREKLMFRIKVRIDPELLRPYANRVKTGLPGVAYVRLDASAEWPENLKTRLPRLIPPSPTTAK